MNLLSALYGRAAGARRAWFSRRPYSRQQLPHPVVSVGNLVVGGSGKTPTVAFVAQVLRDAGERPAILSRGYGRRDAPAGVVVVSDGRRLLEPVARAGDEPFMLAQSLPEVPVLVCDDRYLAGQLAARQFGATVSILDDGFQHLRLARDVDLLLVGPSDLDERVLPVGRLREPLSAAAAAAHAVVVPGDDQDVARVAARLGVARTFRLQVHIEGLQPVRAREAGRPAASVPSPDDRVFAVAGIARPERFLGSLERQGWRVADHLFFRDHHWFTAVDLAKVHAAAQAVGATAIVTTDKDAVRLSDAGAGAARPGFTLPWFTLPMRVTVEPHAACAAWLVLRVQEARAARTAARA